MLEQMSYWQKGILLSLGFSFLISLAMTGALIISEYVSESRGIPHICGAGNPGAICDLDEAVGERLSMLPKVFLILSLPLCVLSFAVGILMERFVHKP